MDPLVIQNQEIVCTDILVVTSRIPIACRGVELRLELVWKGGGESVSRKRGLNTRDVKRIHGGFERYWRETLHRFVLTVFQS